MKLPYLTEEAIETFISNALKEDVGEGDHTSIATLSDNIDQRAQLLVKGNGILAGVELASKIFTFGGTNLNFDRILNDGEAVKPGDVAFTISGNARTILSRERLVLNCMQRMSGIATYTSQLQSMIAHTKAKVTDTRKTTPNFRLPEKWAVAIGGGHNHRFGLFEKILLKDNHVDYSGGIKEAIEATRKYLDETGKELEVEVETRNIKEVMEVLEVGHVDTIMLDNMPAEEMKEALNYIGGRYQVEASGNITEENIREVAECGVDFISVGALTHSYKSLDLSLKAF